MKLTKKTNIGIADKDRLADNEIYAAFQATYNNVFDNVPDVETNQCKIQDGQFVYSVNANEKYFYETKYVNLRGKCTNLDTLGINFPDTINIENIGKAKKDLLDFVYNVTKDETALRFEGNRGYGKTTILRYLFFYVVPILNSKNEKKITPLYVSFNEQLGYFNQENEKGEIKKKFYNVLSDKIKNYYADVLSDVNNKFWGEYLSGKDGFGDYTTKLKRIENKKCSSTEKITEKEKLIDEFLKSPQAILHCFAYAAKERDKSVPVIILDDLDPLNTSVVQSIFEEIYSILHSFKIKVIYTIRPATAKKIKRIADFTKNPFINLNKPELLDVYLEKYIKIFINNIDNGSNTTIELKDKKIEISESKKFYYNFLDILKQSRSRDLLENIADGNIRLYKELVKTCLCSGFIKSEGLIAKLIDNSFDIYQSVPYWIIYNSVITQNHKLLFPEVKVSNSEHIINLLCNGGEMFHKYLVRLYLLSYFTKRGDADKSYSEIVEVFSDFFNKNDKQKLENSLRRALKKLNNTTANRAGLVRNEDKLFITDGTEFDNNNYEFRVTDVGRYYYNKLITTFEYLSFMKDDVDYPDNIAGTIQNNIEATNLQQRFDEITKYIGFLFDEEKKFINSLNSKQKRQSYKDNFSPSTTHNKLLFSELFADSMINYGTERDKINITKITELKTKIDIYITTKKMR